MKGKRVQERARVTRVVPVGSSLFWLHLEAPHLVAEAPPEPGQFLHVLAGRGHDPLLRRPLSVLDVEVDAARVELYLQVVGKGSRLLASLSPGETVDILGPLGRGFRAPGPEKALFLVAGGVGLAPLYFLARRLGRPGSPGVPPRVVFLLGARSRKEMPDEALLGRLPSAPFMASDDGSIGHEGTVIDLLRELLTREEGRRELVGCGPPEMMAALAEFAGAQGLPCQVSLEQVMGCGVGACQGCVIEAKLAERETGAGEPYARVCTEGPVFEAEEVNWQALLAAAPHRTRFSDTGRLT